MTPWRSVSSEPPRQVDVEDVEVDFADGLEELGGPGLGQRLGQLVAPRLVLGLQGPELGDGRGPPLGPRAESADDRDGREPADGLAGGEALAVSPLALGGAHGHAPNCNTVTLRHVATPPTPSARAPITEREPDVDIGEGAPPLGPAVSRAPEAGSRAPEGVS